MSQEEIARLTHWLAGAALPHEPFQLHRGARVGNPLLFYAVLRAELAVGPSGCRWPAALAELRCLAERFGPLRPRAEPTPAWAEPAPACG